MRKNLWLRFCPILAVLAINCFLCAPAFSYTAYVTSVSVQGNVTSGNTARITVTIFRSPDLDTFTIYGTWQTTSSGQTVLGDCNCLSFPPGVTSYTENLYAEPTRASEIIQILAEAQYATCPSCGANIATFSDSGTTTSVTVLPVTLSAAVTPNVVSPGGSDPELTVTVKNGIGALVHYGGGLNYPTWDCTLGAFTNLDYSSNPNVAAQLALPVIQAPFTQVCNVQAGLNTSDGGLTASTSVTYQESPKNADLGSSFPRSGCEGMCGSPINLTNGNTWTQADDYELPGLGGGISLRRTWNSQWSSYSGWILAGMFGDSWQSNYEKHMQLLSGGNQLLYWRGDGSSWLFTSGSKGA